MMNKLAMALSCAGLMAAQTGVVLAGVTPEEAKKLGTTLTAVGAEKAGNKEGTIPEYTGGLTTAPVGFDKSKGVRPDPFANEKPLFSIDAKNQDKYADKLTEGTKALMKAHAGFRIDVYPTHRTVGLPKYVQDNTIKNATRGKLNADGDGFSGSRAGAPFPIPKNGNEAMLNHTARFDGVSVIMPKYAGYNVNSAGQMALSTGGVWTLERPYYDESKEPQLMSRARANYMAPARRAGEVAMTHDNVDGSKGRRAWQYLPGQRRVRLAPDLAYDGPNPSTAGMSVYDDVNLFNGKLDRFDWKLVGKKEVYVPYNTYRFTYYQGKPEEIFLTNFVNPDVVRWELHRVWVVDATLKEGQRHVYSRRTFYLDEDSWNAIAVDQYDGRGQLWRPGFAYLTQSYDVPVPNSMMNSGYDLIAGTYYVALWPNGNGIRVSDTLTPDSQWTADSLAGSGVR